MLVLRLNSNLEWTIVMLTSNLNEFCTSQYCRHLNNIDPKDESLISLHFNFLIKAH